MKWHAVARVSAWVDSQAPESDWEWVAVETLLRSGFAAWKLKWWWTGDSEGRWAE
jgi:hypothetical protein